MQETILFALVSIDGSSWTSGFLRKLTKLGSRFESVTDNFYFDVHIECAKIGHTHPRLI